MSAKPSRFAAGSIRPAIIRACCSSIFAIATAKRKSSSARMPGKRISKSRDRCGPSSSSLVTGLVAHRPEGTVNPKLATGEIELHCRKVDGAEPERDAAVSARQRRTARRRNPPQISLHRSAPRRDAADSHAAASDHQRHARLFRRAWIPGRRNADARPQHARGGPRLSGPQPHPARLVLRPAAIAAACTSKF